MGDTAPATGRGRILVVEDDPTAARFAAFVLGERGGFDVTHVIDPVIAMQRVADEHWDLVLADLDLPHMSGLDLLASVRRIAPGLPVVMTTAMAVDAARARALFSRADAFLEKPIGSRQLIMVTTNLIGSRPGMGRAHPPGPPETT
jgi:CheY-like chemotaxis protein